MASWQSPSLQVAPRHTVQGCISGESMATYVNLTDLGFEPTLLCQKARTPTILAPSFFTL